MRSARHRSRKIEEIHRSVKSSIGELIRYFTLCDVESQKNSWDHVELLTQDAIRDAREMRTSLMMLKAITEIARSSELCQLCDMLVAEFETIVELIRAKTVAQAVVKMRECHANSTPFIRELNEMLDGVLQRAGLDDELSVEDADSSYDSEDHPDDNDTNSLDEWIVYD